jgi:hypothetical protein
MRHPAPFLAHPSRRWSARSSLPTSLAALSLVPLLAGAVFGAVACAPADEGEDPGAGPPSTREVRIERFSASRSTVMLGATITLSWRTRDAAACRLEPGFGTVPRSGEVLVAPTETTLYTLRCEGGGKEVFADVTVQVLGEGDAGPDAGPIADGGEDEGPLFELEGDLVEGEVTSSFDELGADPARLWFIPERQDVVLEDSVICDGHFPAAFTAGFAANGLPCVIPAGTRVDSYVLHAVGPNTATEPLRVEGTVIFAREILGLQWSTVALSSGDENVGRPSLTYPSLSERGLGLDSGDEVVLEHDRRTLRVAFEVADIDQLRVITLAGDEPPAFVRSRTLLPTAASDLRAGALTADDHAVYLVEKAVVLEEPLDVDAVDPGWYAALADLPGGTLPAGTAVQGFYIHFDPAADGGGSVVLSFTLPRPILGLALGDQTLALSKAVVGLPNVSYAEGSNIGVELSDDEPVWLGGDRRSVLLKLNVANTNGVDQLRVLYEPAPEDLP